MQHAGKSTKCGKYFKFNGPLFFREEKKLAASLAQCTYGSPPPPPQSMPPLSWVIPPPTSTPVAAQEHCTPALMRLQGCSPCGEGCHSLTDHRINCKLITKIANTVLLLCYLNKICLSLTGGLWQALANLYSEEKL